MEFQVLLHHVMEWIHYFQLQIKSLQNTFQHGKGSSHQGLKNEDKIHFVIFQLGNMQECIGVHF